MYWLNGYGSEYHSVIVSLFIILVSSFFNKIKRGVEHRHLTNGYISILLRILWILHILYTIVLYFLVPVTRQNAVASSTNQNEFSRKLGRKWGTEHFNNRFQGSLYVPCRQREAAIGNTFLCKTTPIVCSREICLHPHLSLATNPIKGNIEFKILEHRFVRGLRLSWRLIDSEISILSMTV